MRGEEKNGKALPVFKLWFVRELTTLKTAVKMTGNTMRKMLFFYVENQQKL